MLFKRTTKFLDDKLYPNYNDSWDNDVFRKEILKYLQPHYKCLDYGAGRGNLPQMNFKGIADFVAGVDPSDAVFENPYLDEAKLIDLKLNVIPFDENTFDLIFSDNVLEHIENPGVILKELFRVLKPGGVFLAKTPNKYHYMPLVASFTPTWFHVYYNKLRGREEIDTFPTRYKLNTAKDIKNNIKNTSFSVMNIEYIEGRPEYLRIFPLLYLTGFIYERIVNSSGLFKKIRCVLMFTLKKTNE